MIFFINTTRFHNFYTLFANLDKVKSKSKKKNMSADGVARRGVVRASCRPVIATAGMTRCSLAGPLPCFHEVDGRYRYLMGQLGAGKLGAQPRLELIVG